MRNSQRNFSNFESALAFQGDVGFRSNNGRLRVPQKIRGLRKSPTGRCEIKNTVSGFLTLQLRKRILRLPSVVAGERRSQLQGLL